MNETVFISIICFIEETLTTDGEDGRDQGTDGVEQLADIWGQLQGAPLYSGSVAVSSPPGSHLGSPSDGAGYVPAAGCLSRHHHCRLSSRGRTVGLGRHSLRGELNGEGHGVGQMGRDLTRDRRGGPWSGMVPRWRRRCRRGAARGASVECRRLLVGDGRRQENLLRVRVWTLL